MHRTLAVIGLLPAVLVASPAWADCNDPFGKPEEVLDFHINMARADWTKLLADRVTNVDPLPPNSPQCADQFPEYKAEFRCGTTDPWLKVAVRRKKGEERGVEAFEKPPMKIDFNEDFMGMVPSAMGQRWPASMGELGFRKLTLNNGTANKSAAGVSVLSVLHSEHVALRLLAKDVPLSPRTAYAKVTVHFDGSAEGTYVGVYILIEDLDRTALRRRGLAGTGRLEKQSTANCSAEPEFDDGPPNESKAAFDAFIAKNPSQFAGRWLAEANKGLDVDTALRQEAIREILVNGNDTLFNSVNPPRFGNNWYAYDPRQGVRVYAPWDLDLAFGQQNTFCGPDYVPGGRPLQCPPVNPLLTYCTGGRPYPQTISNLGVRLPCNPDIQKRYLEIMCQQTNGPLAADEILKVWNQVFETLRTVVPLERERAWKGIDPMAPPPNASILETFGSEHERLKAWIPARIKFVQQEITRLGVQCNEGCANGATDSCSYLGCASQRRCENGKWTACLPTNACAAAPPQPPAGGTDGGAPADGGRPPVPGTGGSGGVGGTGGVAGAPAPTAGAPGTGGQAGAAPAGTGGGTPGTGGAGGGTAGRPGGAAPMPPPSAGGSGPEGGCACHLGLPATSVEAPRAVAFALGMTLLLVRRHRRRRPAR
jgi:hypothetical protein